MRIYSTTPWGPLHGKPPLGSQINRADPLARNLIGAWLFNEGQGNTFLNIATPHHGVSTGTSNAWKVGQLGTGIANTSGTGGIDIADEASFEPSLKFSVAIGFVLEFLPNVTAPLIVKWDEVGLSRCWAIGNGSTNLLRAHVSYDGLSATTITGSALTAGVLYHAVISFDAVAQVLNLYKNGLLDATLATGTSSALFNGTAPVQFNRANFGAGVPAFNSATFYYAYIWDDRALSKGDVVDLMLNPYRLVGLRPRQFAMKTAATATTFRFLPLLGAGT